MIVHLSTNYVPVSDNIEHGGVERIIRTIAQKQINKGNEVRVFGVAKQEDTDSYEYSGIYPSDIQLMKKKDMATYKKIMSESNRFIYFTLNSNDVIHDHFGYFTTSEYGELLLKNKRIIVTLYGLPDNQNYQSIYNRLSVLKKQHPTNLVLVCCSFDQKKLFEEKGFKIDCVIHNCITVNNNMHISESELKSNFFLSIATIIPEKGHESAIEFVRDNNAKLVIIGNVEDDVFLKKLLSENVLLLEGQTVSGIEEIINILSINDVVIIEQASESLKRDLLHACIALVFMPKWREPFALSVLEAMACGKPIIHNGTPSILEAVEKTSGILYSKESFSMSRIFQVESQAVINQVKKFSADIACIKYEEIY